MTLIGTEGGFLDGTIAPKGVVYNNTVAMPLVLGPAERADIIVDFSKVKTSTKDPLCFILYNDAPVPFPGGTPLADFDPANKALAVPPMPGYGPNTRTLMQFRVRPLGAVTGSTTPDPAQDPAWVLPPSPPPPLPPAGTPTRDVALCETVDEYGRLAQNLGTLAGPCATRPAPTEVVPGWHGRALAGLQHDRRHAPDPLPLLQRPGAEARQPFLARRRFRRLGAVPAGTRRAGLEGNREDSTRASARPCSSKCRPPPGSPRPASRFRIVRDLRPTSADDQALSAVSGTATSSSTRSTT